MKVPKYKLGDMILLKYDGSIELITQVIDMPLGYVYKTKLIEGKNSIGINARSEVFIQLFYTVIGNILDRSSKWK